MFRRYRSEAERTNARGRLQTLSRFLDNAIALPGTTHRVGYDAIIGLVPGIGDTVTTLLSAYVVYEGYRLGADRTTIAKMVGNVALDYAIGLVPGLGDVADVFFKANQRNLRLLGLEQGKWVQPAGAHDTRETGPHQGGAHAWDREGAGVGLPRRFVANVAG